MKRTFIAIKIPLNNKTEDFINFIRTELKDEKIKWVENYNLHITLFFLGDIDEIILEKIICDLDIISKNYKESPVKIIGAGSFKKGKFPKTLWLGIHINSEITDLQKNITEYLKKYNYTSIETSFKPHLTIGRIKFIKNIELLKSILRKYKETVFNEIIINSFILYESQLTPAGPKYKILKEFSLSNS